MGLESISRANFQKRTYLTAHISRMAKHFTFRVPVSSQEKKRGTGKLSGKLGVTLRWSGIPPSGGGGEGGEGGGGGIVMILVASCCGNRVKLRLDGPLG